MAQITIRTDDLDQSPDAEEVKFSFKGQTYSIDLAAKNLEKLEKFLKPYIDAATLHTLHDPAPRLIKGSRKANAETPEDREKIRTWARANNFPISDSGKGRISQTIRDAYSAAMG